MEMIVQHRSKKRRQSNDTSFVLVFVCEDNQQVLTLVALKLDLSFLENTADPDQLASNEAI